MYETQERAKRITDIHVLWGQSTVIEELIQAGKPYFRGIYLSL